ncbi:MAG: hypothetical protein V4801_08510 [Burkholderia gladioli]
MQHDGSGEILPRGGRAGPALHCEGQQSPQQWRRRAPRSLLASMPWPADPSPLGSLALRLPHGNMFPRATKSRRDAP